MVKKVYIGLTVSAFFVSILAYLLAIPGVEIQASPDFVKCAGNTLEPCVGFFNITSKNESIKFYNSDSMKLSFSPSVEKFDVFKYSLTTKKWTKINFPFNITKGVKYMLKVEVYKKDMEDTVKWGIKAGDAEKDPVFLGYTKDDFFVQLLEVRNEQSLTDRIGSSIRFKFKNPMTISLSDIPFGSVEQLLDPNTKSSTGRDILIKNTTLKPVIRQNITYPENTTKHSRTFENNITTKPPDFIVINWTETSRIEFIGKPYTELVDSGWINLTENPNITLKSNETIEMMVITYFKMQLGPNRRDVIPSIEIFGKTYKQDKWATQFLSFNKVFAVYTQSLNVTNATIWVEFARVTGLDPSADIRDDCADIRVTNYNNDSTIPFGIGTREISGCETANNRTQINFRATVTMNSTPVHIWLNDSAVTNFGNITYIIANDTLAANRTGYSSSNAAGDTWTVNPYERVSPADNTVNFYYRRDINMRQNEERYLSMYRFTSTNGPNAGGSCFVKQGFKDNDNGMSAGFAGNNRYYRLFHDSAAVFGAAGDAATNVMHTAKVMYADSRVYFKWFHSAGNETQGGNGFSWNVSDANTTSMTAATESILALWHNNLQCRYYEWMTVNATEEPAYYNQTVNISTSPVFNFVAPDTISPQWSNCYNNSATQPRHPITNIGLQCTWTDVTGINNTLIEHNASGTNLNFTATANGNFFTLNITSAPAGLIRWRSTSTDNSTNNNRNATDYFWLNITQANMTRTDLFLNGTQGNITQTVGTARVNATGVCSSPCRIFRNGTNISTGVSGAENNTLIGPFASGVLNYTVNGTDTQNFTINQTSYLVTIPVYSPTLLVFLNGTPLNQTYEFSESANITTQLLLLSSLGSLQVNLSIEHGDIGDNIAIGSNATNYTWTSVNGSLIQFNSTNKTQEVAWEASGNRTLFINLHGNDTVYSAKLNLTGASLGGNTPTNVKIFINNTLSNTFTGTFQEGSRNVSTFNNSDSIQNISFNNGGGQARAYIKLPAGSNVTSARLNLTGLVKNTSYTTSQTICGNITDTNGELFDEITVDAGVVLTVGTCGHINLTAKNRLNIFGSINGTERGVTETAGVGSAGVDCTGGGSCSSGGGGGAGYGDSGGAGGKGADTQGTGGAGGVAGIAYGNSSDFSVRYGSLGGQGGTVSGGNTQGGARGAYVFLKSRYVKINGSVNVTGGNGVAHPTNGNNGGSGAGSGGTITTVADYLDVYLAYLGASGGCGGGATNGGGGGGGSGGRIKNYYNRTYNSTSLTTNITGGCGGTSASGTSGNVGSSGSLTEVNLSSRTDLIPGLLNRNVTATIVFDAGEDGTVEFSFTGEFNHTNRTSNFSASLNTYLAGCTASSIGECNIPLFITSATGGRLQISGLELLYSATSNPISLDVNAINSYLRKNNVVGRVDVPINFSSTTSGKLLINGTNIKWYGTSEINITAVSAGNANISSVTNATALWLKMVYSNFSLRKPYTFTDDVIFVPPKNATNNTKNMTVFGQTVNVPTWNVTSRAYNGSFNLSVGLKESVNSCLNFTFSNTSNRTNGITINGTNTTLRTILNNVTLNQTNYGIWTWLDLNNCNRTAQAFLIPNFTFKSCGYTALRCF